MTDKLKGILVTVGAIAMVAFAGGAIAGATSGNHSEKRNDRAEQRGEHGDKHGNHDGKRITGSALVRARNVALAHTGGGKVTDTEVGDEEGYYEVEVSRKDGSRFDVHLDRNFNVIDSSADGMGDKHGSNDN